MTKKAKKALIITLSVLMTLVVVIGCTNLTFFLIGQQEQIGVSKGDDWSSEQKFDISKIKSLDIGKEDFKILCLTDIHYKNHATAAAFLGVNYILDWAGEIALRNLVKDSDPDLIIVTGDTTLTNRNDLEYKRFVKIMDSFKIPWAPIFGNHDEEGRADKAKLVDVLKTSKYSLFEYGPQDMHGAGNYVINLKRGEDIAYSLFLMDTGMCTQVGEDGNNHEESINAKQVEWYNWNIAGINSAAGKKVPNMAFCHIPLPEYTLVPEYEMGEQGEKPCPQYINYGFFDTFKANGGTHAFAGHDHSNNFIGEYQGVKLAYVQKSSYNCYFKMGMLGGTMVTLDSNNSVDLKILNF